MYSLVRLLPSQRDIRPTRVNRLIKSGKCRWRVCHLLLLLLLAINLRPSGPGNATVAVENAIVEGSIFHFLEDGPGPAVFSPTSSLSPYLLTFMSAVLRLATTVLASLARSPWFMLGRHGKPLLRARSPEAESCLSLTPPLLHFFPPAEAARP